MFMPDQNGSDNEEDTSQEGKALVNAASNGHLSRAKRILNAHPELVNYKIMGKTSLHLACHSGHSDIIKLLLETPNCDTNIKDSQGYVAIHHAAYGDKSGEALKVMLAHDEDPNTADNDQKSTPLHLAVKETNVNAVRCLVQSEKCDVNLQVSAMALSPL
ncbi:E3 ubiquitin-protein ligase MIB1 [Exaiptasia diaphana]|nr:E3 ubiquitin-protein ligase MIB1 [Exaiptasia diaphana]